VLSKMHMLICYCTGSIKKGNRHSEILLRDLEVRVCLLVRYEFIHLYLQHIATLASLYKLHKKDYVYPKVEIDAAWEKVLLNQCEWDMAHVM
jgi:alpha-mannosidase